MPPPPHASLEDTHADLQAEHSVAPFLEPDLPRVPTPPPQTGGTTRRGRTVRLPWKVRNQAPTADETVNIEDVERHEEEVPVTTRGARRVLLLVTEWVRSPFNHFGLRRFYKRKPLRAPNVTIDLDARYAPTADAVAAKKSRRTISQIVFPYPNLSAFLFDYHHKRSRVKTLKDRADLQSLMKRKDFLFEDVVDVSFDRIDALLAQGGAGEEDSLPARDGWVKSSVVIGIPSGRKTTQASRREDLATQRRLQRHQHIPDTPPEHALPGIHYAVHGFWRKRLCPEIVRTLSTDPAAKDFVFDPYYVECRIPGTDRVERVHGEAYTSQAFVQEDIRLQNSPPEPGCELPRVIVGLMFWSDATQLAQFGQAKVWPLYLYYGNQSKYERGRPTAHAGHHVAYFVSVCILRSASCQSNFAHEP